MGKKPAKQSSGNSMIKNIAIGVITPVLAATIIYFLGFNKTDDKSEFKKKKAATEKAWSSYVQNKAIFSAVMGQLGKGTDIEAGRLSINHEIDVTVNNLADIKKDGDADHRIYSSIDISMQQMKEIKIIMNKFLDDLNAFAATAPTEEQGQAFVLQLGEKLGMDVQHVKNRDTMRLNTYYREMNKDYDVILAEGIDMEKRK